MVDWDNETTVGTPATDVQRISILQRRYELIEAYEEYVKKKLSGVGASFSIVQARLRSLFIELQAALKRRYKKEVYDEMKLICWKESITEEELVKVLFQINEELDTIQLIKIDTQKVYNSSRVEQENKVKGY